MYSSIIILQINPTPHHTLLKILVKVNIGSVADMTYVNNMAAPDSERIEHSTYVQTA